MWLEARTEAQVRVATTATARLTDRQEVRVAGVPRHVVIHQVRPATVHEHAVREADVLRDVGRADLVEPQLAGVSIAARRVLVQHPERDAQQPREARASLDREPTAVRERLAIQDRARQTDEAGVQLGGRNLLDLGADVLPGILERRGRARERPPDLVVVEPLVVRCEAHEVVERVGRRVIPAAVGPGGVDLAHVERLRVPAQHAVAAIVLGERERFVGFERVGRVQVVELERQRLLAALECLAAVTRGARVERGHVDLGVVDRVDRVERRRGAQDVALARRQVRGLPAAADDVDATEHEQRAARRRRGLLILTQPLDPDPHMLRERQVGEPEANAQAVRDRDAVASPAVARRVRDRLGRKVAQDVRDEIRARGVRQIERVLEVGFVRIDPPVEVQVLGVGDRIGGAIVLAAVDRGVAPRIDRRSERLDDVAPVVALGVGRGGGREVGHRQAERRERGGFVLVEHAVEPGVLGVVAEHRQLAVQLAVLGVDLAVRHSVRGAHLVLAHPADVDVQFDAGARRAVAADARHADARVVVVVPVVDPQLDELRARQVQTDRVEAVHEAGPHRVTGGERRGLPRHRDRERRTDVVRALRLRELRAQLALADQIAVLGVAALAHRLVPVHLGVPLPRQVQERLAQTHRPLRDRRRAPRHARPSPAIGRELQRHGIAHTLHVVDEHLVARVRVRERQTALGLDVELGRRRRAHAGQRVGETGQERGLEAPLGIQVGDQGA